MVPPRAANAGLDNTVLGCCIVRTPGAPPDVYPKKTEYECAKLAGGAPYDFTPGAGRCPP
jgi:hypothetical protein